MKRTSSSSPSKPSLLRNISYKPRRTFPETYVNAAGKTVPMEIAIPVGTVHDIIQQDFKCPICLGTIQSTSTVTACLHRFCSDCLHKSLRGNLNSTKEHHDCPSCRFKLPSKRSTRADTDYDEIIRVLTLAMDRYQAPTSAPKVPTTTAGLLSHRLLQSAAPVTTTETPFDLSQFQRAHAIAVAELRAKAKEKMLLIRQQSAADQQLLLQQQRSMSNISATNGYNNANNSNTNSKQNVPSIAAANAFQQRSNSSNSHLTNNNNSRAKVATTLNRANTYNTTNTNYTHHNYNSGTQNSGAESAEAAKINLALFPFVPPITTTYFTANSTHNNADNNTESTTSNHEKHDNASLSGTKRSYNDALAPSMPTTSSRKNINDNNNKHDDNNANHCRVSNMMSLPALSLPYLRVHAQLSILALKQYLAARLSLTAAQVAALEIVLLKASTNTTVNTNTITNDSNNMDTKNSTNNSTTTNNSTNNTNNANNDTGEEEWQVVVLDDQLTLMQVAVSFWRADSAFVLNYRLFPATHAADPISDHTDRTNSENNTTNTTTDTAHSENHVPHQRNTNTEHPENSNDDSAQNNNTNICSSDPAAMIISDEEEQKIDQKEDPKEDPKEEEEQQQQQQESSTAQHVTMDIDDEDHAISSSDESHSSHE